MFIILSCVLTLIHVSLLGCSSVALRHSASRSSLVLRSNIRKPSFVWVWNLSRLSRSHDVDILTSLRAIVMLQSSNAARSGVQHLILLALAPQPNNLRGCAHGLSLQGPHSMRAQSSLSWLPCIRVVILIWIPSPVGSTHCVWAWLLSHLTLGFVSVRSCYLLQALNLACHIVTCS